MVLHNSLDLSYYLFIFRRSEKESKYMSELNVMLRVRIFSSFNKPRDCPGSWLDFLGVSGRGESRYYSFGGERKFCPSSLIFYLIWGRNLLFRFSSWAYFRGSAYALPILHLQGICPLCTYAGHPSEQTYSSDSYLLSTVFQKMGTIK